MGVFFCTMQRVCVVGANGFIGSHIVKDLLMHNYNVVATTRKEPSDSKVSWLTNLPKLTSRDSNSVSLLQADPNISGSLDSALVDCTGCIIAFGINDPAYPEWVDEMVQATKNVTASCEKNKVNVVVLLTSTGTTNPPTGEPEFKREDEHFSDPDLQKKQGKFASCAKTLAERTLFDWGKQTGTRTVAICPSAVIGPRLDESQEQPHDFLLRLLTGERKWERAPNGSMSFIHVSDLARLHVAALSNSEASGRFFGVCDDSSPFFVVGQLLQKHWPSFEAPAPPEGELVRPTHFDFTKQKTLGVECRKLDEIIGQHVSWLQDAGYLKKS